MTSEWPSDRFAMRASGSPQNNEGQCPIVNAVHGGKLIWFTSACTESIAEKSKFMIQA